MEMKKTTIGGGLIGALLLLLGFGLLLGGCSSDAVAPQEQLPALTEKDAAQQAALIAVGITKAGPELLAFNGKKSGDKELGIYPYVFPEGGDISGSIMLEYFTGGAEGAHSHWNDADYGLLYTVGGETVTVAVELTGGTVPVFGLTFDLHGPINQAMDTAEVAGSGFFKTGETSKPFTIPDTDPIVLTGISNYPTGGVLNFSADGISLQVVYDGDHTAGVVVAEVVAYIIDLDTGIVVPFEE